MDDTVFGLCLAYLHGSVVYLLFFLVSALDAYNIPLGSGRTGRTYTSGVGWHGTDGLVAFLDHDRVGTG